MTLVAGVFLTVCIFVVIISVFTAGKFHQFAAAASPASGCHDNDMAQQRVHRQEIYLSTLHETKRSSYNSINAWNSPPEHIFTPPTVACFKHRLAKLNFMLQVVLF